jgi:two-component system sensor histidine kinase DegS
MSNTGVVGDQTMQGFIDETYTNYEQTQRELKEIDILIKQSAAEVERWAQRNAQVTNEVRQMESQLETMPREYIKEKYETLQNTQQRLFTMRGQLEKLQSDQRNLQRLTELQHRVLESVDGLNTLPDKKPLMGTRDQTNIIRVIQTQEAERQSLVRRMHDGPASSLSNFILQAEICQRLFDNNPDRARTELSALKSAAASTFSAVKDFIFDLRPMMLDDLGVVPTLRRYVETFQEKSNLPVSMNVTGTERRLEGYVEVTIFRAVQELLNNARIHAQATQLQVGIDLAPDVITVLVEDNGSGFNVDETLGNRESIGLPTIRERIEMLGGNFILQSSLGQGTRAEITIPVEAGTV